MITVSAAREWDIEYTTNGEPSTLFLVDGEGTILMAIRADQWVAVMKTDVILEGSKNPSPRTVFETAPGTVFVRP